MTKYRLRPEVIDTARANLGVHSDEQLAARLGLTSGTISRARRGESPSFITVIKILDAAGAPISGIEETAATGAA